MDSLYEEINSDLDAVQVSKSQLANTLGAYSPVALLPTEILCTIAVLVAQDYRPYAPVDSAMQEAANHGYQPLDLSYEMSEPEWLEEEGGRLGWISLSHVCQSWRRAFLGCGLLWADEFGSLPRAVDEILARSGGLPLTMRTYSSGYRDSSMSWRSLLRDDVRCRVQKIYCLETRSGVIFKENSDYAALNTCHFPMLETLDIAGNEPAAGIDFQLRVVSAPQLRAIDYHNIFIPVSSRVVESVSCTITRGESPDEIMRSADLISLFSRNRESLDRIVIDDCITDRPDHWPNSERIPLPKLQSLTITRSFSDDYNVAVILDGLILGEQTVLKISILGRMQEIESSRSTVSAAVTSIRGSGFHALSCFASRRAFSRNRNQGHLDTNLQLKLYASGPSHAYLGASIQPSHESLRLPVSQLRQKLDMRVPFGQAYPFSHIILSVSQSISISHIGVLVCGGSFLWEEVHDLLKRCTSCHTLQIVDAHTNDTVILRALADSAPTDVLPRLQNIWLTQTGSGRPLSNGASHSLSLKALIEKLSSRRQQAELAASAGMPTSLTIDASVHFTEEESEVQGMMQELAALVPNIDWCRT